MKKIALAITLGLFLSACSSPDDVSTSSTEAALNNTSDGTPIPMSDSHENGRYFLISQTAEAGVETIEYVRKSEASDSYGKMQINCATSEIRKYSSSSLDSLIDADLGDWAAVSPGWTDEDIVTFICN